MLHICFGHQREPSPLFYAALQEAVKVNCLHDVIKPDELSAYLPEPRDSSHFHGASRAGSSILAHMPADKQSIEKTRREQGGGSGQQMRCGQNYGGSGWGWGGGRRGGTSKESPALETERKRVEGMKRGKRVV